MAEKEPLHESLRGSVPNPDPTALTTDNLRREIGAMVVLFDTKLDGATGKLETRLGGMDKAIELLQQSTNKVPDHILAAVNRLQELHEGGFRGIEKQFVERDKRTEQLSIADKTAIAAALQAQKEAAGAQNESNAAANTKMEGNFAKLIDQLAALQALDRKNFEQQINDLKQAQSQTMGRDKGSSATIGYLVAAFGVLFGLIGGVIGIANFLHK